MKRQSLFSEKNTNKIINLSSAELAERVTLIASLASHFPKWKTFPGIPIFRSWNRKYPVYLIYFTDS